MKVISLLQPYATLVTINAKLIETRSWATKYRGPLAIHASKGFKKDLKNLCIKEPFFSTLTQAGCQIRHSVVTYDTVYANLPLGVIIATCNLVDVRPITADNAPPEPERSFGDYTPGRFAWILEDIKPLREPIPAKGQLGLWEFDLKEDANGNLS